MCYSYNYLDESFENIPVGYFCISYIGQAYFLKLKLLFHLKKQLQQMFICIYLCASCLCMKMSDTKYLIHILRLFLYIPSNTQNNLTQKYSGFIVSREMVRPYFHYTPGYIITETGGFRNK